MLKLQQQKKNGRTWFVMVYRIKDFINRGTMPLVGREAELRVLLEAFNGLLEGEPRSVWMNGPPGVGKSRLLDELKERARDHAARSLVVHAKWYEGEGVELGPLSNALEILRPALAAPIAARLYREGAVTTVDAAVEAVQVVSRRYPVILIFDDLHYLRTSAELGRFVAALEEIPILLIATTRPVENPALRSLRLALAGSIPPLEQEIGPLDGAGIAEAATALFGIEPPEEMIGQIADLSAGVPLALREVFRELMTAEHIIQEDAGGAWKWAIASLPEDELRGLAERVHGFSGRLATLPDAERNMLALAAYLGEQFNRDLLRTVAEKTTGWDDHAFERLILSGFVSVATPSIRLGAREQEGRVCYAFTHTLLWKAAGALEQKGSGPRERLASITLDALTRGIGELYSVAPLEGLDSSGMGEEDMSRLFRWLVEVGRRLPEIYSELYATLCEAALEPYRKSETGKQLQQVQLRDYLAALSGYGERLYLAGSRLALHSVAEEISEILERIGSAPPANAEERVNQLDAAVVVWRNATLQGDQSHARGFLDELLNVLPPPAEQTDRELRGAAEAIRLRASHPFDRGDFAVMLDVAAPYIDELDRMRPETLNALLKVLLYAMMRAGRMEEAEEMVQAALRLRHEADLFTEYELLMHAANYARQINALDELRAYTTEARSLVDRYPAYRNLSTNYWYLPYVVSSMGDLLRLEQLEKEFRAAPPPARSSPVQTAVAQYQFQAAWNMLAMPEQALRFAGEIDRDCMSALQKMLIAQGEIRSCIDMRAKEELQHALQEAEKLSADLGGDHADPESKAGRRHDLLRLLGNAVCDGEADGLLEYINSCRGDTIDDTDGFRVARLLLETAEQSEGRKREFNDAAYKALELATADTLRASAPGLAHHHLDQLKELLPKTRLIRFRQAIGADPRNAKSVAHEGSAAEAAERSLAEGKILRAFGALRMEGAEESGAKLESKTRTLVAALVVARLGDTRSLGELTRDRLADLLWPDMSLDRAVNNLHATLSYARRFLGGSDTVMQRDGVYELGEGVPIDAVEFRECIRKANRLHDEGVYFGAAVAYRQAITLAEGDFMEGMYAEWVDVMRETLRGELATALERLIDIEIDRDNSGAVPPLAERLLTLDDLHDGAYEALIRSAAVRGARREAFTYYKRYEAALDEYGAGPTRKITELIESVRAGELG